MKFMRGIVVTALSLFLLFGATSAFASPLVQTKSTASNVSIQQVSKDVKISLIASSADQLPKSFDYTDSDGFTGTVYLLYTVETPGGVRGVYFGTLHLY